MDGSAGVMRPMPSDAYAWARQRVSAQPAPVQQISNPPEHGLDAGLDHVVKMALDSTGLMDELEKVTGKLDQLTQAAQEWQAQAKAMREVAQAFRDGAEPLSGQWQGQASDAFGTHMGRLVEAIDSTAADMEQTAQIISSAAAECKMAEDMIIEIIREAIEALIVSLAAMIAVDIITLGLATLADAIIADAEIAVFVGRVARVSEDLAKALKDLMKAVKEMRSAEKKFKEIGKGLKAANNLRKLGGALSVGKAGNKLARERSLASLGNYAAAQGVKHYNELFKSGVELATGIDGDPAGAAKEAYHSDTNQQAMAASKDGQAPAAPYRVPKSDIEETFG
jgi:uncharacterized protein YukE